MNLELDLAMSLGYFMNTRWGGLAAAVAAQVPEELHSLNPVVGYSSEESSNQFAFALPYGTPLSIASAYPSNVAVSSSANNSNNNCHVSHPHGGGVHPYTSFAPVDLGLGLGLTVDPLSRLSSPSMVRGLNTYPPGGVSAGGPNPHTHVHNAALGLIGVEDSMIWQPQQPLALHPHQQQIQQQQQQHPHGNNSRGTLGLNHALLNPATLLPILSSSTTTNQAASDMPSDSPPTGGQSSSTGKSNGAGNGVVTKPKAKPRQPEEVLKYFR